MASDPFPPRDRAGWKRYDEKMAKVYPDRVSPEPPEPPPKGWPDPESPEDD